MVELRFPMEISWSLLALRIKEAKSFPVSIFIAGCVKKASVICRKYCDDVGLCVTVTPTNYIYTNGEEEGIIIGLINYPRFPSQSRDIVSKAGSLAQKLLDELEQQSCTIQTPDLTIWISNRPEDN